MGGEIAIDLPTGADASSAPAPWGAPRSDRVCDTVVLGFALWTLCAHAVVAAGRGLYALLALFAAALTGCLVARLRWGALLALPALPVATAPSVERRPALWARWAGVAAAAVVTLTVAMAPDPLRLWGSAVPVLVLAACAVWTRAVPAVAPAWRDGTGERTLWLLAVVAVCITLVSHRFDTDDAFYVNVAVSASDAPGRALLAGDTMHGIPGLPLHLPVYRVHSYELLNGAVAYLTGIPPMYVFHWVSAAFAALLVPLALARLLRILAPRHWLALVVTVLVVLVAVGETHRWYGNFAFVRMWQGKSIMVSALLPLIYAYAIRFALRPNRRDWVMLAAAQIAALGASSSALWAAPIGAMTALGAAVPLSRRGLRTAVLGALASLYVLGAAWVTRQSLTGAAVIGNALARAEELPPMLSLSVAAVLGDARLFLFGIAVLLAAWAVAPTALARRFAIAFPLAVWVVLLNPYTSRWLPTTLTGPSYWRTLWVLPWPMLMAFVLASPLWLGSGAAVGPRRLAWAALLALFALAIPRAGGLSADNGVELDWPRLKVPVETYQWAARVNASVPPGSHVAVPERLDRWIVTFPRHATPLLVGRYLHIWPGILGVDELSDRIEMRRFLETPELVEAEPQRFRDGLDRFDVRGVGMVSSPEARTAMRILRQAGFHQTRVSGEYTIWVRSDPAAPHRAGRHR